MKISLAHSILFAGALLSAACASNTTSSDATTTTATAASAADTQRSATVDQFEIPKNTTTTASGLQYSIAREGNGAVATNGHKVDVHYTGWLTDGTKFDSSRDRGKPFSFVVGQGSVIKGWDEGVAGMKVGEQRVLVIPADLGYGARGAGGVIPPNATLVFRVELVNVH